MPTDYTGATNFTPKFGVEIEFTGDPRATEEQVRQQGTTCYLEDYNHQTRDYWKIVSDASCGYELVSPPLEWHNRHQVRDVMRGASAGGARVTVDCGLHVHHEWPWYMAIPVAERQDRLDRLVVMYEACEPLLKHLLTESRLDGNEYVQFNSNLDGDLNYGNGGLVELEGDYRFTAVNGHSLPKYGTIEFRQHQGTLNPAKALAWVEFTRQLVNGASLPEDQLDHAGANDSSDARWNAVFNKLSTSTRRYMTARTDNKLPTLITMCRSNATNI